MRQCITGERSSVSIGTESPVTLSRRNFLGLGAAAVLSPVAACVSTGSGGARDGLPDWANAQIDAAVARFRAWKGNDDVVAFTFVTDIHSHVTEQVSPPLFSDSRYHTLFTFAAADRAGCDFLVDGGDHDYEMGEMAPGIPARRMAVTEAIYQSYTNRPVLFCLGNHDHGPYLGKGVPRPISSSLFGDTFNGLAEKNGFAMVFGTNRSWGYYDVPGKRFRAIFCNTSDDGYYGLSSDQLDFVRRALETLPADHTVALFGHFCVFDEIGHWKRYSDSARGKAVFMKTLEDFSRQRPNALVGYFCGDSHFDNELEFHGVNWTVSQGYGGVGRYDKPWGARFQAFDRSRTMNFELVGVKPSVGEFRMFRVGIGGVASDRTCVYFNREE